jgi:Flp pilus assembly protein TadG
LAAIRRVSKGWAINMLKIVENQSGNVAIPFALSLVALLGAGGGTLEVVRVVDTKAKLQSSVDSATLAAALGAPSLTREQRIATAQSVFAANVANIKAAVPGSAKLTPITSSTGEISFSGEVDIPVILGTAIFGETHDIEAKAVSVLATEAVAAPGVCTAPPTATDAPAQILPAIVTPARAEFTSIGNGCIWATAGNIAISGANVTTPSCDFYAQGNASVSGTNFRINRLLATGNIGITGSNVTSQLISSRGPVTVTGSNVSGSRVRDTSLVVPTDPYETGLFQPVEGACTFTDVTVSAANRTLTPGTYCGTTALGSSNVAFNPGVYIFRGPLTATTGNLTATGGVTFYFSPVSGGTQMNLGSGNFSITAPSTGDTKGLAIYERYGLPQGNVRINGSNSLVVGIIYLPQQDLNQTGINFSTGSIVRVVARSFLFNGSNLGDPNTLPVPFNGSAPPPFQPAPSSTAPDLVPNGSFELPVIPADGNQTGGSLQDTMPSWTTTGLFDLFNARFSSNGAGYGTDGAQYAELHRDLSQTVTTVAGQAYEFSFDYRYGDNGSVLDNRFEVVWNGQVIATINPPNPTTTTTEWKRISFPVIATGASTTFTFRQVAGADVNHGASLDRVRLVATTGGTGPGPGGCPGNASPPPPPAKPARPGFLRG